MVLKLHVGHFLLWQHHPQVPQRKTLDLCRHGGQHRRDGQRGRWVERMGAMPAAFVRQSQLVGPAITWNSTAIGLFPAWHQFEKVSACHREPTALQNIV